MDYCYQLFNPSGNVTALILGLEKNGQLRRRAAQKIMEKHPEVEQVGFVSLDKKDPRLMMAGGEFCGNALRAAACYYLAGQAGELSMKVSGAQPHLKAGSSKKGEFYAQIPLVERPEDIVHKGKGFYQVNMPGIVQIVMPLHKEQEKTLSEENVKRRTLEILQQQHLLGTPAAGVMFLVKTAKGRRIYPCVRVAALGTLICEQACGSGTMAVGLVEAVKTGMDVDISLLQPSGQAIHAQVLHTGKKLPECRILGSVNGDNRKRWLRDILLGGR
jgi:diaminopimelate epimerase